MGYNKDDITVYKDSVRNLCIYSAEVQRFTELIEQGRKIDRRCLVYAMSMTKSYRRFTLQVMNRMGVGSKIEFMEDNEFQGFSIKQGRLTIGGDRDAVLEICRKWIYGFPDGANYYQYAVAMYCIALAYPDALDRESVYPDYMLKGLPRPVKQSKAA